MLSEVDVGIMSNLSQVFRAHCPGTCPLTYYTNTVILINAVLFFSRPRQLYRGRAFAKGFRVSKARHALRKVLDWITHSTSGHTFARRASAVNIIRFYTRKP